MHLKDYVYIIQYMLFDQQRAFLIQENTQKVFPISIFVNSWLLTWDISGIYELKLELDMFCLLPVIFISQKKSRVNFTEYPGWL